jgi:hypothetical protein
VKGTPIVSLDKALNAVQTQIPECVAVGYVDMSTGMLLGAKTVDSHPSEVLDLVAAATADLFQGPSVTTIEKLFRRARGNTEDGKHYFQEILVMSENLLHIFMRSKKFPTQAACIVCRSSVNIGMALVRSRQAMPVLDEAM